MDEERKTAASSGEREGQEMGLLSKRSSARDLTVKVKVGRGDSHEMERARRQRKGNC